jgi:uroporphyrinogen decarboxylase
MNKRDAVLNLLDTSSKPPYIPAAFFLHFDPACRAGQAAVDKHLEFFRYTGMDFVKIQYERKFPPIPEIQTPDDWAKMPEYGLDFYAEPLKVVEGLVKAAKKEALVILTLYSPFMFAAQTTSYDRLTRHIKEDPEKVKIGMRAIANSVMRFVRECVRLGLDGFYTSTQGGEAARFSDPASFDVCVRPYDLELMEEINRTCLFSILHVCDYQLPYSSIDRFANYPGQVVNASLEFTGGKISAKEVAKMYKRPFMGGMDRLGVLASGSPVEIKAAAESVLRDAPERFILGADCTVPADTSWDNLKIAIDTAHNWHR